MRWPNRAARRQALAFLHDGPRLVRLAVRLGVVALVLSAGVLLVAVLRPSLEPGPSSTAAGTSLDMTAEAYTFTDPEEAAAVYSVRNTGLLPVTVHSGALEDGGTVELLDAAVEDADFLAGPVVPSRTVPAGGEFAVRVTADWPACGAFGPGSGVQLAEISLTTTVLGVPRTAVVTLSPALGLRATTPVEPADDCDGVVHVGEGW